MINSNTIKMFSLAAFILLNHVALSNSSPITAGIRLNPYVHSFIESMLSATAD